MDIISIFKLFYKKVNNPERHNVFVRASSRRRIKNKMSQRHRGVLTAP